MSLAVTQSSPVMRGIALVALLLQLSKLSTADLLAQDDTTTAPVTLLLSPLIPLEQNPLLMAFRNRDRDGDRQLSLDEFAEFDDRDAPLVRREFIVFDTDADGALSPEEFITIPMGQTEEQQGVLSDPVILLAEERLQAILNRWKSLSPDQQGRATLQAFDKLRLQALVPGLEQTQSSEWDRNRDGAITPQDVARTLELAYGIRTPAGELMRNRTGRVVDWRMFRQLRLDAHGMVQKSEYFRALGATEFKERWFLSNDKNGDGQFDYAEFASGGHRTDPVAMFLNLDLDLDGLLIRHELNGLPADWQQMARFALPGFDTNQDSALSLREYQLLPHVNLLANWPGAQDQNNDGRLSRVEFRFDQGIHLAALTAEYFHRFDVNHDDYLSQEEFLFQSRYQRPNAIYVQRADGTTMTHPIPNYPIIYSPEISPDGQWVAVDGWQNGQPSTSAHLLVVNVETGAVKDLGVGCIPHWSADGQQLGFSRYGQGVFLCSVYQEERQEKLIDREGWSIHLAPNGQHAAFVSGRGNFTIYDLKTGTRRAVFADGESPYRYIEHNFAWSPDSRRLCFKGHRQDGQVDVAIVSAVGPQPKLRVRLDGQPIQSDFAWHPDGLRILFPRMSPEFQHSQIYEVVVDEDGPPTRFASQPHDRNVIGISFSRDGETAAFMTTNHGF